MNKLANKVNQAEAMAEKYIDRVTTHPLFLEGISTVINLNSYRKIAQRNVLRKLWKTLELPDKHNQEKTLYLVAELEHKIRKLERDLREKNARH
jgi:hypothetical protein